MLIEIGVYMNKIVGEENRLIMNLKKTPLQRNYCTQELLEAYYVKQCKSYEIHLRNVVHV